MIIALRIPSPKNGVRRRVETRKLGVLGSETAQNTQFSGIFPFPLVEDRGSSRALFKGERAIVYGVYIIQ
jgi:hypothetical protein